MLWIDPNGVEAPHKVTRPQQVHGLCYIMKKHGWIGPALIGYIDAGKLQLLSGTHRQAAAIEAGIKVPVRVRPYKLVWEAWGNDKLWQELMQDKEIECPVTETQTSGEKPSLSAP